MKLGTAIAAGVALLAVGGGTAAYFAFGNKSKATAAGATPPPQPQPTGAFSAPTPKPAPVSAPQPAQVGDWLTVGLNAIGQGLGIAKQTGLLDAGIAALKS
jgi:hypothetical protein